jgi:hypothetical protein
MRRIELIGLFPLLLLISACGGTSEPTNSGPTNSIDSGESEVSTWQSYCGSEPGWVHRWEGTSGELTVERLPLVSPTFHSGYAIARDGDLIALDLSSGEQFRFDANANSFAPVAAQGCTQFVTATHSFVQEADQVAGCPNAGGECKIILIFEGTFPYVFAEHNGHVLAATNWGDVLIFDGTDWCRASRSGDTYRCDPNEPMVMQPRGVQFYSSIDYMGKTLIGEWPTGRLYEFDGQELRPAAILQPPFVTGESLGYEAQSIAEYCGDLFVGYWPRGEIWRRNHSTGNWSMAARLFSHPVGTEPFIPYSDRPWDGLSSAFYGQRVTALVPLGYSLYAATSNLRSWPVGYEPEMLNKDDAAEYGAIHRLTIPGCETIEALHQEIRAKEKLYRKSGSRQGVCAGHLPLIDWTRY